MNQNKKSQPLFGIHHAVWDDVLAHCKKKQIKEPTRTEFLLLVRVATKPEVLRCMGTCKKQIEDFGLMFAQRPDDILELLTLIRKTLSDQRATANGRIRHFLLQHKTVYFHGVDRPIQSLTAGEIAQLVFPSGTKFSSKVTESVKKERQKLYHRLESRVLLDDPDMIHRYRTGVTTPRLKKLLTVRGMK